MKKIQRVRKLYENYQGELIIIPNNRLCFVQTMIFLKYLSALQNSGGKRFVSSIYNAYNIYHYISFVYNTW